ncbi:MAG: hypothetical protein HUJ26_12690 [Planctomycetaceae bacterium]|nr:hypothetical protein [Planctomycetaceae bacterium]
MIRIYELELGASVHWYAANSKAECIQHIVNIYGYLKSEVSHLRLMSDSEMEDMKVCDNEDGDNPRTFRDELESLVENGCKFPREFCADT